MIEMYFDDQPEPITIVVGPDDISSVQQTVDGVIYLEKHGVQPQHQPQGDLH